MIPVLQNAFDNPILTRELRRRMRGKALVFSIIGYIVLMAITTMIVLLSHATFQSNNSTAEALDHLRETGVQLFRWITGIQSLLVLIVAPTITAGMTTGEKERKTFDFLRVTTITPWMYIMGCFLSTVFYVGLALLCALPLLSMTYLYGGVGLRDVASSFGLLFGGSLILSAFGLYMSSVRERTRTAQGVVVFLIFALLFGGILVTSKISSFFGTATTPKSAFDGIYVLGVGFPLWFVVALGIGLLTQIFLLVATRKLFEPEETRALGHWHFALLFILVLSIAISSVSGRAIGEAQTLAVLSAGVLLLAAAAQTFAVGRMEVGDEIWHLKRLFPLLRPFDQTVPFLGALAAGWYLCGSLLARVPASNTVGPGVIRATVLLSLAGFAFFCAVGRLSTAMAVGRRGAGRATGAVIFAFWVAIPVLGSLFDNFTSIPLLTTDLMRASPIALALEGFGATTATASRFAVTDTLQLPGTGWSLAYLVLALGCGIAGEYFRWKRWRGFDYHYDMPAA